MVLSKPRLTMFGPANIMRFSEEKNNQPPNNKQKQWLIILLAASSGFLAYNLFASQ